MKSQNHKDLWHSELIAQQNATGGTFLKVKAGIKYGGQIFNVLASNDIKKSDSVHLACKQVINQETFYVVENRR